MSTTHTRYDTRFDLSGYEIALALASDRGWSPFPCHPGTKHPATGHGVNDASNRRRDIEELFIGQVYCNVAIATGPSNLIVVDQDWPKDPHGRRLVGQYEGSGMEAWDRTVAGLYVPSTYTVITRSGGRQLYFNAVPGHPVGNSNGTTALGPSVDIKAIGGSAMAAGSYFRATRDDPVEGVWRWDGVTAEVADPPDWLLSLLPLPGGTTRSRGSRTANSPAGEHAPFVPIGPMKVVNSTYVAKAIEGDLRALAETPAGGGRRKALFRIACNFGHIAAVPGVGIDPVSLADTLLDAAMRTGLDEDDAMRQIGRGIEFGLQSPRNWRVRR